MKTKEDQGELPELTEEEKVEINDRLNELADILVEGILWQHEQKYKEKHPELYKDEIEE